MITLTVEAVLVVLLVLVLMQFFKKKPTTPAVPQADLANLKPTEAALGDVISVSGAGDEYSDLDFTVDRYSHIQAGAREWTELGGVYKNRRVGMRVATTEEGDIEVGIHTDARKLALTDFGLSEPDLADLDERQNTEDWFEFDKKNWQYLLSREAQASTNSGQITGFYYWEFREKGGTGILSIRKAEGEPFTITIYSGVPAGNVTVYRGR